LEPSTQAVLTDPFAQSSEEAASNREAAAGLDGMSQTLSESLLPEQKNEETPLSIWEKERAQELNSRREAAQVEKLKQLNTAKEELAKFYADREAQLVKVQKANRAEEKNFKAEMKALMEHGSRWEKVHKLVNVAPKPNEKGQSKVDRYRKLLIQLKAVKDSELDAKE